MKSLDDFLKNETPKRKVSKLKELENEIVQLYNQGYQVEQIQKFLVENEKKCSLRNIYYFLERKKSAAISSGEVKKSISQKIKKEVEADKDGIDTNEWLENIKNRHKK